MTPQQRIRRIKRMMDNSRPFPWSSYQNHKGHICARTLHAYPESTYEQFYNRLTKIDLLMARELDWLCREALLQMDGRK